MWRTFTIYKTGIMLNVGRPLDRRPGSGEGRLFEGLKVVLRGDWSVGCKLDRVVRRDPEERA